MYLPMIKKELLANMYSMRYAITFFLFLLLSITATVIRTELYKKQVDDYQQATVERYRSMEMVERFWQSKGLGITVEKAPNPLSIFAAGLENEMTRSFSLSDWKEPTTGLRKLNNPSFRYFLNLDMVLIINIVCSLLALMLIFDSIAGEREQGTLKVLLAGPLPRDVVIVSKMAAGLITLLVPLALSWCISMVYVLVFAKVNISPDQAARLAWIILLSLCYISFFFGLGICISSWVHRSATGLAMCLFCWIVFVLAVPNLAPMIVTHFAPIPPAAKILLEKDAVWRELKEEREPEIREELGATGKYTRSLDLARELRRRLRQEYKRSAEKIDRFYNNRIRRQLLLNKQISRVSPSASYIYASTHIAGTGALDFLDVLNEVDAFHKRYLEVQAQQEETRLEKEALRKKEKKKLKKGEKLIDAYDPSLWPDFEPPVSQLAAVLNECWIDIVWLSGGTILLFLGAFIGFLRYDPR